MDTTGIPHELSTIALALEVLPAEERGDAQDRIHHAHLSGLEGAVTSVVRDAIETTKGAQAANEWLHTGAPARYTDRDLYLQACRHGAGEELLEQGFTLPDDTPATVEARATRLAELWTEVRDLAVDLTNSGVHGAKTKVAAALEISVDTVDRRFARKS